MTRRPPRSPARTAGLALALLAVAGCDPGGAPVAGAPAADAPSAGTAAGAAVGPDAPRPETADERTAAVGQTLYVPAYSHIFHQDGSREIDLTTTLSVRNTDPDRAITVAAIGYHDSDGRLVRRYGARPFRLGPLASEAFVVEARDRTGGVGANFLVEWHAEAAVSPPLVEAVMISTAQSQGISLVSRGRVVRAFGGAETAPPPDL